MPDIPSSTTRERVACYPHRIQVTRVTKGRQKVLFTADNRAEVEEGIESSVAWRHILLKKPLLGEERISFN